MRLPNIVQERLTDIHIYLPTKKRGESFDSEEGNLEYEYLPSIAIKGYVSEVGAMQRTLEEYGLRDRNSVKVLVADRYRKYFELAGKIIIDNNEYQVFREGVGNNAIIYELPNKFITVVLQGV